MRNMIMEPVTRVREGEEKEGGAGEERRRVPVCEKKRARRKVESWKRCKETKKGKVLRKTEGGEVAEGRQEETE